MDETALMNQAFFDKMTSDDPGINKQAADTVNEFTRLKMREDGILRNILPPIPITNDELDRQVDTDKPVKIVDREIDSPAAQMIPFGTLPNNRYIEGNRYRVMFARLITPKFSKDVEELRTYNMDIRQVLSDNALKDMLAEEDGKGVNAASTILGAAGSTVAATNTVQYRQYSNEITRTSVVESKKIMGSTPNSIEPATALTNHITIRDIEKWGRDEMGGDLAQDMILNGFGERKFLGLRWIITIKKAIIPTNTVWYFADPKFLGKFYVLEDTVLHLKREMFMIEFCAYECIGAAWGNVAGLARADFNVPGGSSV